MMVIYIYYDFANFDEIDKTEKFKISKEQFVQLLEDWQEKVCKNKLKKVIITEENGQFSIELIN